MGSSSVSLESLCGCLAWPTRGRGRCTDINHILRICWRRKRNCHITAMTTAFSLLLLLAIIQSVAAARWRKQASKRDGGSLDLVDLIQNVYGRGLCVRVSACVCRERAEKTTPRGPRTPGRRGVNDLLRFCSSGPPGTPTRETGTRSQTTTARSVSVTVFSLFDDGPCDAARGACSSDRMFVALRVLWILLLFTVL